MMNNVYLLVIQVTHWVMALYSGMHVFSGAWRRYAACQWPAIGGAACLALYLKNPTLHCIQLRFLG